MSRLVIDRVAVVDARDSESFGDDTTFVAVHAVGRIGWYGPVSSAVGRHVATILAPIATGADAADHQGLQVRLRNASSTSTSRRASWAVGALDCAAWDLHGQHAEQPVANLLAPAASRQRVPAYASRLRRQLSGAADIDTIGEVLAHGWAFAKCGLRGDPSCGAPVEADRLASAAERVAEGVGARIAVDAVGTWTPALALAFARRADPAALVWLEDPLPGHDPRTYRSVARTRIPLAVGEHIILGDEAIEVIEKVQPVALTLDVVGCGGITRAVEILAAAEARGIPIYPHGRSLVPGIHLAAAYPAAVPAVEYRLQWEPGRQQRRYAQPWVPSNGHLTLLDCPGLGATPRRAPCRVLC